jgi:hypothetical protein
MGKQRGAVERKQFVTLLVRTCPQVNDPREMQTILTCSLRSLWGDLEPHSWGMSAHQAGPDHCDPTTATVDSSSLSLLVVKCRPESEEAIRAALTWVTLPPYMQDTLYRVDVVDSSHVARYK